MASLYWPYVVLAMLVATPVTLARAQSAASNPWYIPPAAPQAPAWQQPQQPSFGYGAQGYQQMPQAQGGYGYGQPQPGFGAGYAAAPPAQTYQPAYPVAPLGYPGAVTGSLQQPSYGLGGAAHAAPAPQSPAYQPPPMGQPAPQPYPQYQPYQTYQQPFPQQVAPQAYPIYRPQPFGDYPPLGSDPTERKEPARSAATAPARETQAPAAQATGLAPGTALQHPGFAGPSTLNQGYGGIGGYTPFYPSPYGAAPYLGLPLY